MNDDPNLNAPDATLRLSEAEAVVDALNRVMEVDHAPRARVLALLERYRALLGRDRDVQLILHDDLRREAGPRVLERFTSGPTLDRVEPRPDEEVQAFIDRAVPAVKLIMPDMLRHLRTPRVYVLSQDLAGEHREWFEQHIVAEHLAGYGWNDLMIAAWAADDERMVAVTVYGRPELPAFDAEDRRLVSLLLRAAAPMIHRDLFDPLIGKASPDAPPASPMEGRDLSGRQLDVLRLLLQGHSEKEVARDLGVSTHTVHTHVKRLYTEFDVSSRGELLALFVDRRILGDAMS